MDNYEDLSFDEFWDQHVNGDEAEDTTPDEEAKAAGDEPAEKQEATEDADGDSDTKDDPGAIPYRRFSEVAKERREYKAKVQELEAALAQARQAQQAQPAATPSEDDETDALLREILGDEYEAGSTSSPDPAIQSRLQKLEEAQAQQVFESEITEAIAKYPDVDRNWLIKETIRTNGNFSPMQLAESRTEAHEVVSSEAVANFLDKHPELAEVYKAKYGSTDGNTQAKKKPRAIPNLSNTASKPEPQNLDPKEGESNSAFLSRLWDNMAS